MSLIETSVNRKPAIQFFISGPKDSSGCEISGVAKSDSGLFSLYQGKMFTGGYYIGYVELGDKPPGTLVTIGFSIKYKGNEYSLGGSVNVP